MTDLEHALSGLSTAEKTTTIGDTEFAVTGFGMLRQLHPRPFTYDRIYLDNQSTNLEMSYLRLGYLLAHVPYDQLRASRVLELGPGRGVFFDVLKSHVEQMRGYDVVQESPYATIPWSQAAECEWDLVCGFDVLEHFEDIDRLWELDFQWGYFSIPAPPAQGVHPRWRHFKPDEHLWHITAEQFEQWASAHGYRLIAVGCPEDCLRARWDKSAVNIQSFIIQRN